MNIWECEKCTRKAIGVGGAIGLKAIGWYFKKGGEDFPAVILCPEHHPEGLEAAELQAKVLQDTQVMKTNFHVVKAS